MQYCPCHTCPNLPWARKNAMGCKQFCAARERWEKTDRFILYETRIRTVDVNRITPDKARQTKEKMRHYKRGDKGQ